MVLKIPLVRFTLHSDCNFSLEKKLFVGTFNEEFFYAFDNQGVV